jgi:hypothetical protein
MRSAMKKHSKNRQVEALVQSRKDLAKRNYEAVRVTVQAMRRRGSAPDEITVHAISQASGVSAATLYRRDDLFELVHRANPGLRRRHAVQAHRQDVTHLQTALAAAQKDSEYHKKEAEVVKIGTEGFKVEIMQLRKRNADLQREIQRLRDQSLSDS